MQQLHSDLWIADAPLRFLGLEVGARMTIVRLPGRKLLLHSPIAASPDLVRCSFQISAAGPIIDDQIGPVHCQLQCAAFSDPSTGTSHQCDLIQEFHIVSDSGLEVDGCFQHQALFYFAAASKAAAHSSSILTMAPNSPP